MALITTKTGDTGMTQLNPGQIASKTHPVIDIMGVIDETSCTLGLSGDKFDAIQTMLYEIMGYLYFKRVDARHVRDQVDILESYITSHNNSIPTWFVNARGTVSLARAVCRRAERRIVEFVELERAKSEDERYMPLSELAPIMQFFNRLSDYLFVKSFEREVTEPQLFTDELAEQEALPLAAVA